MKTRTNKELLQVLLDNQKFFRTGICDWIINLYFRNKISFSEANKLQSYCDRNFPKQRHSIDYVWHAFIIKPRIKWIKQQIKKHEINRINRKTKR